MNHVFIYLEIQLHDNWEIGNFCFPSADGLNHYPLGDVRISNV